VAGSLADHEASRLDACTSVELFWSSIAAAFSSRGAKS
jgi:hypothetical protein